MPKRVAKEAPRTRHFIKAWRKHRGLSQEALASRLEMSAANLSRIETGKQDYTQGLLEAIAEALATEPASLIIRDPTQPEAIWSIWDHATPAQRSQIVELARVILKTGTDG